MQKILVFLSLFLILPVHAQEVTSTVNGFIDVASTIGAYEQAISSSSTIEIDNTVSTTVATDYVVDTERELISEPNIRVGLKKTRDVISFVSEQNYQIFSKGEFVAILPADEKAKISYKNGIYFFKSESLDLESKTFWRFEPVDFESIFNIPGCKLSYTGRKIEYCAYRGILEYRYSPKSGMPYLINELPLEDYMKGIAETDNNSAEGYIKAVLVAARSYAYKNISPVPATDKRMFDVYATTQDQLYLGYTSEQKIPRVAQFAQDTAGEMVTYDSKVVTTPYSSRSGGATKNWKNSKGINDRPWLKSVECVYDKGKKKAGHGLGMSTYDALMRATKDNWNYVKLLTYYYSDTQVEKIY